MGHRQVGRSKKAKKQGTSLMDVPLLYQFEQSTNLFGCVGSFGYVPSSVKERESPKACANLIMITMIFPHLPMHGI